MWFESLALMETDMSTRIDNARVALFVANKNNSHSHLADHKRPMLSTLVQVTEEITLKPGTNYYLPGLWCNTEPKYQKAAIVITVPNDINKPLFSGGVKTK